MLQYIPFAAAHPASASIQEGFRNAINSVSEALRRKWENEYMQRLNAHYMRQGAVLEKILSENGELPSNIIPTKQGLEYALIWHGIKKGLRDEAYQRQMREIEKTKAMIDDKYASYKQAEQLSPTKDPEAIIPLAYSLYKKQKEEEEDKNLLRALQKYTLTKEIGLPYEKEKIRYREELKSQSKPKKIYYVEYKGKPIAVPGKKALEDMLGRGAILISEKVYNEMKLSSKPSLSGKPLKDLTDKDLITTYKNDVTLLKPYLKDYGKATLVLEEILKNPADIAKRKTLDDVIEELPLEAKRRAKLIRNHMYKVMDEYLRRQGYILEKESKQVPEGSLWRGKDGRIYIVKNGKLVLYK